MASDDYTDKDHHEDLKVLHGMGYAQELSRSMSKFSNFAISFSIICILSGGINSFAQAISSVGGAGAGIGWIVGCLLSGMFALAMAQIASAFPTAGGLYHWASILGSRFWGWLTAWLNLLGLITVLGAINIGTAYFFAGTFGSFVGFTGSDMQIVVFVAVIKPKFGYDDALDVFGVHGVGGTVGMVLTGLLADPAVNGNLMTQLSASVGRTLWLAQLKAMGLTVVLAVGARFRGQASFSTAQSRNTSACLARVESAWPVMAIKGAPMRLRTGRMAVSSSDSPLFEMANTRSVFLIMPRSP